MYWLFCKLCLLNCLLELLDLIQWEPVTLNLQRIPVIIAFPITIFLGFPFIFLHFGYPDSWIPHLLSLHPLFYALVLVECILYWLSKKRGGEEENKFLRIYMSENAIILPSFLVCLGIELYVRNDFPLFWRLYQFLFPCCCWDFWRHYDSWSLYMICPFSLEAYKIFTLFLAFLNFCDVPLRASVFIYYAGPLAGPLSPWNSSLIAGSPLDLFHWWLLFCFKTFLGCRMITGWLLAPRVDTERLSG